MCKGSFEFDEMKISLKITEHHPILERAGFFKVCCVNLEERGKRKRIGIRSSQRHGLSRERGDGEGEGEREGERKRKEEV